MITLTQMTEILENGLNAVNDIPNTQFRVIPDVAKYKRSARKGNVVTNYINCILTASPSANETANGGLIIAIEQFKMVVLIPLDPVKTTPKEDPQPWQDDTNVYVQHIKSVIDEFFAANVTGVLTDSAGTKYSIGYTYSLSATGEVAQDTSIGRYISFDVNISVAIVQGGVNSMDVELTIDGKRLPYQSFVPARETVKSSNAFSDDTAAKTIVTATAFSMDISAPALENGSQAGEWLTRGGINKAHIVGMTYEGETKYFLMQYVNSHATSTGVLNVGETYAFAECAYIPDMLDFSDDYTVSVTEFDEPTGSINVTVPGTATRIYLLPDGTIEEHEGGTTFAADVPLTGMFGDEDGGYYAYVISVEKE